MSESELQDADYEVHNEPYKTTPADKNRHGCLTAWLAVMILANVATAVMYYATGPTIAERLDLPMWGVVALGGFAVLNVLFAGALFAWKKWGFYGFAATTVLIFGINVSIGVGVLQSVSGLLGVVILYAVLQMGDPESGWDQLD